MKPKNKQIIIVGNVGLGKSSLSTMLAEQLSAKLIPADTFFEINPFFPLAVENRKRWSLASDLWFLKERVKLAKQTEQILESVSVVVDSGIQMSYVYAQSRVQAGFLTYDEWKLYQEMYEELTKDLRMPDLIVYLTGSLELVQNRVEKRGREFELKYHTQEYLRGIQKSLDTSVEEWKTSGLEILDLSAENSITKLSFLIQQRFI